MSPIQGRKCAWYSVSVTKTVGSGDNSRTVTVAQLCDMCRVVYLDDGTGNLRVAVQDLQWADCDCNSEVVNRGDTDLEAKLRELFGLQSTRGHCVTENTVPVNEDYFAYGQVLAGPDGRLVLTNGPEGSLLAHKSEKTLLDWMESRVFKAKWYVVLLTIAITVVPLAGLLLPKESKILVLGLLLPLLFAFLVIYQQGKHYELPGRLSDFGDAS